MSTSACAQIARFTVQMLHVGWDCVQPHQQRCKRVCTMSVESAGICGIHELCILAQMVQVPVVMHGHFVCKLCYWYSVLAEQCVSCLPPRIHRTETNRIFLNLNPVWIFHGIQILFKSNTTMIVQNNCFVRCTLGWPSVLCFTNRLCILFSPTGSSFEPYLETNGFEVCLYSFVSSKLFKYLCRRYYHQQVQALNHILKLMVSKFVYILL